jgi:hypothetical protein
MTFPSKDPQEVKLITFDFTGEAPTGAILTSPVIVVAQAKGIGAVIGDVVLVGSPAISGLKVRQLASLGITGASYLLRCDVDGDNGEHHIIEKWLPVSVKAPIVE